MKVSKISIDGFRGATQPVDIKFDDKPVILIFGENGSGKSTVVDAFDFICNQKCGALEGMSITGNKKNYVPSIGISPNRINISLSSGDSIWSASLSKDIRVSPNCPQANILRRNEITKLITAIPSKRFEELHRFVEIPIIESVESSLREAVKVMELEYNLSVKALSQANINLRQIFEAEDCPGTNERKWAEQEAGKNISTLNNTIKQYDEILRPLNAVSQLYAEWDNIKRDTEEKNRIHDDVVNELEKLKENLVSQSSELLAILESSKKYLQNDFNTFTCPVCEQTIVPQELLERLSQRIESMSVLSRLIKKEEEARNTLKVQMAINNQKWKAIVTQSNELLEKVNSSNLTLLSTAKYIITSEFNIDFNDEYNSDLDNKIAEFLKFFLLYSKKITEQKNSDQKSLSQSNLIKTLLNSIQENEDLAKNKKQLKEKLGKALIVIETNRKNSIDNTLKIISDEVDRMYQKLHPDEAIGSVKLYLKQGVKGSLELEGQFHGKLNIPPHAYFSESHLDTLGICIFLALAKHFNQDNQIIILDDVLTSVDNQHLDRFMKLISEEAEQFGQIIITTHYRGWRDRYRWAKGDLSKTQVIELGPWTLQNGIHTGEFISAIDELRNHISLIDRQALASKAGIILESILDFITLRYHLKVPRNAKNEYTLGDLASSMDRRIGDILTCKKTDAQGNTQETKLKSLIENCVKWTWVRNCVGCHFNKLSNDISDSDISEFARSVITLADTIICPVCKSLPLRRPSGSFWQCKCQSNFIEMYPLIFPGADLLVVDEEE
jgi:energy-coupling factor transporter ATP-binding protein EcfA2